ncbi:MAG: type II secretion system minor pseudopilin GspJ [Gammaproteobacteria bacterium]|nr:type II secretion system minor pseudopilin GspJ [Gammaproteobacteria bacterium]
MKSRGFTLIEMLVALLILGILSALAYGTYREARISAQQTEKSLKRTREIEFGLRVMVQDFAEIAPRPIRDPLGQARLPALAGGAGAATFDLSSGGDSGDASSALGAGPPLVEFTRAGWSNTAGEQRSTLQRVAYQLVGTVLKRAYYVVLDPTTADQPVVQDLLTGVKSVRIQYLDQSQNWVSEWPPAALPAVTRLAVRPAAVEIVITFSDWGEVRRLVEVAG